MKHTKTVTRRNTVGTVPAARTSARIRHEAADRETHTELLDAHRERVRSRLNSAPLDLTRWWRTHWDYTAGPSTFLAGYALCAVLRLADRIQVPVPVFGSFVALGANATRILPIWLAALAAGALYGYWIWDTQHRTRTHDRWLITDGASVRELFRPRYTTIDIEKLPHRRTDYGRTPRGYSAEQYAAQRTVIEDSLGHPVTIRQARPGVVAVTQTFTDLLAPPVPFRDEHLDVNPETLWLGIDRDGKDVTLPLTRSGSGAASLFAGAPGSGKSACLNALLAQIATLPPAVRRLWIIDPADGVDLGCWHPFTHRLAQTPREALQLLRDLIRDMEHRRPQMTAAGIDLCVPSEQFPWNVLVMDELPELTLNEDRKVREEACELIARIRRVGRKTNTSIMAATQDVSREVVPSQISKVFSHRLCFKVSTYREADIILPGARRHGYHPELFDSAHPGRLILWNLRDYTEVRAAGLYGAHRQRVVRTLSELPAPRPSDVRTLNADRPYTVPADRPHLPTPITPQQTDTLITAAAQNTPPPQEPKRTAHDLRVLLDDLGKAAGRVGLNVLKLSSEIGEPDWRIRRALNTLGYVKRAGNFVHPEAAR